MHKTFTLDFIYLLPRGRSDKILQSLPDTVEKPDDPLSVTTEDGTDMIRWAMDQEEGSSLKIRVNKDDFLFPIINYAEFPEYGVDVLISFNDPVQQKARSIFFRDVVKIDYLSTEKWRLAGKLVLMYEYPTSYKADLV